MSLADHVPECRRIPIEDHREVDAWMNYELSAGGCLDAARREHDEPDARFRDSEITTRVDERGRMHTSITLEVIGPRDAASLAFEVAALFKRMWRIANG